jgi:hypothetical protein
MLVDHDYELAVKKGEKLLRLLVADSTDTEPPVGSLQTSTQSIFTDVRDLEEYGYTGSRSATCADNGVQVIHRLSGALQALGVNRDMACDGGQNYVVEHKHNQTYTIEGTENPVSNCSHATNPPLTNRQQAAHTQLIQLCNHKDGVLIAHSNHSAPHVARLQDPETLTFPSLHHWSDITYLQWLTTSTFVPGETPAVTLSPAPIKYIFRLSIHNVKTYSVLNKIMRKNGRSTYDAWPGVTFDIESEEGKAILGTPNGAGTAWLLIQHRRQLRPRKIEKVTVFYADNEGDLYRWPSLLFWIV